ncbi:uncharacterized protein LOC131094776 [Melospiza georgiana]|uniref:uncharacterized protein LOC131094776 n=1 Tax=Melospiza georgiana TaxID=44398 RepID=UPI0025AD0E83|nr:uncharacterized protein LOC131094776 [Melospiza georgiana]
MENNFNGQPSENLIHSGISVSTNPRDGSEPWKTIWDFEAVLGPYQLPPRENRFIISRNRLQSLSPYGKRIQALCRGIPSYLAYPAPGESAADGPGAPKCAQIWTAVLLGLVLNPALADYSQKTNGNQQIIFGGDSQITITGISQGVKLNSQTRVAIIEQKSQTLSWKTIWNYNRGVIATKIIQQNTCYISIMNRTDIPSFNSLARLAAESRNMIGVLGRPTKEITFVTSGLVNNLYSYGTEIAAMCSGVTTYMAYEVHGLQANLGSCITLNVLRAVDLRYCNSNGNWNGIGNGNWNGNWNGNLNGNGNWNGNWNITGNWNGNWNGNGQVRKP